MSPRPRSLSGIKPTGQPHWGNYFGAIEPALEMARDHEAFYFIADFHALTTSRDAAAMREETYEIAAAWLACGLDPADTVLWRQSDVPEVCELAWHLACVTGFGLVERAHAVKDARARGQEINFGIVSYPMLMAADILLYDSDVVPVGRDQLQHIEMARDMTVHFNQQFLGSSCMDDEGRWTGEGLKRPESSHRESTAVVPGIDGQKMSKSYGNTIPLFGTPKAIKKRIMAVVTDSTPLEDPKDPDACHVFQLHKLFATPEELEALAARYRAGGFGYGHAKLELFERAQSYFAETQERFDTIMADRSSLEALLQDGAARARKVAREVLGRVREATGLPSLGKP